MNNMEIWRFIDSNSSNAVFNMALDEAIAINVKKGKSKTTLRLYGWNNPSVTLGVFQNIATIDIEYCNNNCISVVRRPTGGRGILHYDELTYSFSSQNIGVFANGLLNSYYYLGCAFKKAFISTGIDADMRIERLPGKMLKTALCFKSASYGELSHNGRKIIGSAQKRWKEGFLQQGSIPFSVDNQMIKRVFRIQEDSSIFITGFRDLISDFNPAILKENIRRAFETAFKIALVDSRPSSQEIEMAHQLAFQKYKHLH